MSGMKLSEKRLPQRAYQRPNQSEEIDMRVSPVAQVYGKGFVLRLLTREKSV